MHIIDSHFHWWPRSVFDKLCKRKGFPSAVVNTRGGYDYARRSDSSQHLNSWAEWFDLDKQLQYMDSLGHQVDVVCSIGPFSVAFSDMPLDEGRDYAVMWNEEMAGAQSGTPVAFGPARRCLYRILAPRSRCLTTPSIVLGCMGVNLPGSVGDDPRIRLRAAGAVLFPCRELGLPIFLHPTDVVFQDMLDGYDGALHLSLGRVIEVSVGGARGSFSPA